jgi:hypothetical protein
MIEVPRCYQRECKHLIGVKQDRMQESTERVVCVAFPDGIPDEIAYGSNPHTTPYPGDHGIRYEKGNG